MISEKMRDHIKKEAAEIDRFYGLPDRFMARELIKLSRDLRNNHENVIGQPGEGSYEGLIAWAILPRLARDLGETDLTGVERQAALMAPRDPAALREYTGIALNNSAFRFISDRDGLLAQRLTGSFANGSPVTIALDRVAPAHEASPDWVAVHIREICHARFGDQRYSSWCPEMQIYPGHDRISFKRGSMAQIPSVAPDPSTLPDIIQQVVAEYAARDISPWTIRDGHCENFAHRVLDLRAGPDWIHKEGQGFQTIWTDQLCDASGTLDPDLIAAHSGGLPEGIAPEDIERIGDPAHLWIQVDGRSYDAETPRGASSFLKLPFLQRHLAPDPSPGF